MDAVNNGWTTPDTPCRLSESHSPDHRRVSAERVRRNRAGVRPDHAGFPAARLRGLLRNLLLPSLGLSQGIWFED